MPLRIVPLSFRQAATYVKLFHRHNNPPTGHKFSIGVTNGRVLCGVAQCGRPIARAFDDGLTIEINRTCTDGTANANSCLYGASLRAAKALGYRRVITYTQVDESGASLRAVGFVRVKALPARKSWADSSGPDYRAMRDPVGNGGVERVLWEARFKW